MSAYQRFLSRDGKLATAHTLAEVAEAAEVQAVQVGRAAEALLKPAEVCLRDHQLQQASAEVQHQQSPRIPELQQLQQVQHAPSLRIAGTGGRDAGSRALLSRVGSQDGVARPGIPAAWREGVTGLTTMPLPRAYPAHAWQRLIVDAERFLDDWAAQAHRLDWPARELFGCCRQAPWGRIQGMGLVLLLRGDEIAALTASEAVIRTPTGAHQTYRRRPRDPLLAGERCLVWELGDAGVAQPSPLSTSPSGSMLRPKSEPAGASTASWWSLNRIHVSARPSASLSDGSVVSFTDRDR